MNVMNAIGLYGPTGSLVLSLSITEDVARSPITFYEYVEDVALMFGGLYTQTELDFLGVKV